MVNVKKRSENFNRVKLEASLKKAGAREEHAAKVAERVAHRAWEGITTVEIKEMALTELRRMDQKAATVYEKFQKRNY